MLGSSYKEESKSGPQNEKFQKKPDFETSSYKVFSRASTRKNVPSPKIQAPQGHLLHQDLFSILSSKEMRSAYSQIANYAKARFEENREKTKVCMPSLSILSLEFVPWSGEGSYFQKLFSSSGTNFKGSETSAKNQQYSEAIFSIENQLEKAGLVYIAKVQTNRYLKYLYDFIMATPDKGKQWDSIYIKICSEDIMRSALIKTIATYMRTKKYRGLQYMRIIIIALFLIQKVRKYHLRSS